MLRALLSLYHYVCAYITCAKVRHFNRKKHPKLSLEYHPQKDYFSALHTRPLQNLLNNFEEHIL